MTMPGFTAERAVSPIGGRWHRRPDPVSRIHEGQVVPQQDWSYHCEQLGSDLFCCSCWAGVHCVCRKVGPIYEF
jgi:hypothetical protein